VLCFPDIALRREYFTATPKMECDAQGVFKMRLVVDGKDIDTEFYAKVNQKKDKLVPKSKRDERGMDHPVYDEAGRPIYRTKLYAVGLDKEGDQREEQNVTVGIVNPVDLRMGVTYRLKGEVAVVHYVTQDNRMGVSITAESVVPQTAASASQDKPTA
jgi:hypothetical protein